MSLAGLGRSHVGYASWWDTATERQIKRRNRKISEAVRASHANRTDKERKKIGKAISRSLTLLSDEEKTEKKRKEMHTKSLRTEKERKLTQRRLLRTIANRPKEYDAEIRKRASDGTKDYYASLSKEEKSAIAQRRLRTIAKKPDDEKEKTRHRRARARKRYWLGLSSKEKSALVSKWNASARNGPNKPERELLSQIKRLGFRYVGDGKFWIGNRNPDFVNRRKKIVVELFGRRWHTDVRIDADRVKTYKKAGYRVVVIWDDLFWKNKARQVRRVERLVGE